MQLIDEKRLYADSKYRFEYVAAYMGFCEEDMCAIQGIADKMLPVVPTLVDAVYAKQFEFDVTKKHFLPKNEGFDGEVANNLAELTLDHPQIKYRKDFLGKYLVRILQGPYDNRFLKYLDWVAKIHTDTPEKKSKINVDYIHINALMGFVEAAIISVVVSFKLTNEEERKVLCAFSKLMWIQNDFYAKYYLNPYYTKIDNKMKDGEKHLNPTDKALFAGLDTSSFLVGAIVGFLCLWFSID